MPHAIAVKIGGMKNGSVISASSVPRAGVSVRARIQASKTAKTWFERADWTTAQQAARKRIDFYDKRVQECVHALEDEYAPEELDVAAGIITGEFRVVTGDRVISESAEFFVADANRVFERADTDVAGGHPGQDRPAFRGFATNRLAGRDDGQAAGRRNAERGHRLADDVFTQHRPQRRQPVAAA